MRRILLISNYYSSYISAGTSQRTKDFKKGLSSKGWECIVITINRKKQPIKNEPDKESIFPIYSLSERYPIPIYPLIRFLNLVRSSNVVHIIDHWSGLNIISIIFCLLTNTPYIYSPCGALRPIGKNIFIKKIYNFFFLHFIFNNAKYIFAVTNQEKQEIIYLTKKKLDIKSIPNGIWIDSQKILPNNFHTKSKLNLLAPPKQFILFVGRLSYIKGPDLLFEAFLKINDRENFSLIFAGPEDNMKEKILKELANNSNIKNVYFLGSVNNEVRNLYMKNALLTVIPSRKEAMSMVALETSILGTPFLATSTCGLDDFISNSAGFICEPNPISIAKSLNNLLEDKTRIKELGDNAKRYVIKNYTWEKIFTEINCYLKNL